MAVKTRSQSKAKKVSLSRRKMYRSRVKRSACRNKAPYACAAAPGCKTTKSGKRKAYCRTAKNHKRVKHLAKSKKSKK